MGEVWERRWGLCGGCLRFYRHEAPSPLLRSHCFHAAKIKGDFDYSLTRSNSKIGAFTKTHKTRGRVLGPLWPTSLAIAPAAMAARATRTMPGGYYRNSGTWGSPDAAKVGPTPWAHQEGKQDMESRQEMGRPISSRRWTRHARTPGGEWVAFGSNLSPGYRTRQGGFRVL